MAASNGHHDAIRILINHGAEVDAVDENQCTPLMFAAMQNHPHCVNELLINGADFTQTDFNGDNALSLAMQNDSKQAQRVLENHILAMLKGLVTGKETIDWKLQVLNQITYTLSDSKNTNDLWQPPCKRGQSFKRVKQTWKPSFWWFLINHKGYIFPF